MFHSSDRRNRDDKGLERHRQEAAASAEELTDRRAGGLYITLRTIALAFAVRWLTGFTD